MAVTSVRNSQAAGAGKKRLLPRNARGTEKDGADAGPHQRDGDGLQQEIGKSAAVQAEKQLPVRVQEGR